jgi:hypothetical protein
MNESLCRPNSGTTAKNAPARTTCRKSAAA